MQTQKPNYEDLGLSISMGPQLRSLVEMQLLADLKVYGVPPDNLKFDWSNSCIEGHDSSFLDGELENFSGISIFNNNQLIAEGWMDFVHEGTFFLAFWDYLTVWENDAIVLDKNKAGIPDHVWERIPKDVRLNYQDRRM